MIAAFTPGTTQAAHADVEAWAAAQGDSIRFFQDAGTLHEAVKQGRVQVVVVPGVRSLALTLKNLVRFLDRLASHQVRFVALAESFDTSTKLGRKLLKLLHAVNQADRAARSANIHKGLKAALERHGVTHFKGGGGKKGRSGRPKGTPTKVTAEVRARILQMYRAKTPLVEIADREKITRMTVYRVLRQEGLKG
jgi:DNA invertase Pin-like site-specific DNA recombinase